MPAIVVGQGPPPGPVAQRIIEDTGRAGLKRVVDETHRTVLARMSPDKRTGRSMESVFRLVTQVGNSLYGVIGSKYKPVEYMDEGTGLYGRYKHRIEPTEGKVLRFPMPGNAGFTTGGGVRRGAAGAGAAYAYARWVRGIRPRHYFRQAEATAGPHAQVIMQEFGAIAARKIEEVIG